MIRDVHALPGFTITCLPGVKLATLAERIFEQHYRLDKYDLVIVHAGTNDINNCTAGQLIDIVDVIVKRYRQSFTGHIAFSTIIPRPRDGKNWLVKSSFSTIV